MYRLIITMLVLFSTFSAYANDGQDKLTTLRITDGPKGVFRTSLGTVKLTSAYLTIKNIGDVEAKDIHVIVILPNGERISLYDGPRDLAPNKSATYSTSAYSFVTNDQKLKADVQCKNCR